MNGIRVTATVLGATVFNTTEAILELTPQNTIRVTTAEPGEPPQILVDSGLQQLEQVQNHVINNQMLLFKPVHGKAVKVNLAGSMLVPEPNESADSYNRRVATTGVPPQEWWAQTIAAQGVKVKKFGAAFFFKVFGITIAAIVALSLLIYVITEM